MTDLVEGRPAAAEDVTLVELPAKRAVVVRISGLVTDMPAMMGEAFSATSQAIGAAGASFAGHPFARYTGFGERIEAEVGFPFTGEVPETDRIAIVQLPGGLAAMTRHVGPYDGIGAAWERAQSWLRDHGHTPTGPAWECYLTGPEDPGPPITEVFWPLA
jgi:effector-binding domain-containing protein